MKKSTFYFVFIFAALLTTVMLINKKNPRPSGSSESKQIFDFKADDVSQLELQHHDSTILLARSGPTSWEIKKPIDDWADPSLCDNLVETLSTLTSTRTISKDESLKAYGLDQSASRLVVTLRDGRKFEIRVGNQDPTRDGFYAIVPTQGEIILISAALPESLSQPALNWQDHLIFRFQEANLHQITIERPTGALSFIKHQTGWQMTKPHEKKGDDHRIGQFLNILSQARIFTFLPPQPKIASTRPLITVSLWNEGVKNPRVVHIYSLYMGQKDYLAAIVGRRNRFLFPPYLVKQLLFDAEEFEEKPKPPKP